MTLTRFQIHERLGSLSGEIKAARELDRENAETLAAKEHEVSLARQAKEKSEANITRLEDEARSLASQYASSVEELIGSVAGPTPISMDEAALFWAQGEAAKIEASLHTNGIDKAFDEATHP